MSFPQGRKRAGSRESPSSASSSGSDEDAPLLEGNPDEDEVHVDFAFCDTSNDDEGSLRALLEHGTVGRALRSFVDLGRILAEQRAVGTVVKVENESDVYAFASVVSLKFHIDAPAVRELKASLTKAAPEAVKSRVVDLFDDGALGWVVRERIVNVPDVVAPPMYACLLEDLEWARGNAESEEGRCVRDGGLAGLTRRRPPIKQF
jgi:hypothetical protein